MDECSFERLIQLLDCQLNQVRAQALFDHLDRCSICRQAARQICRDRRQASTNGRAFRMPDHRPGSPDGAAGAAD